MNDLTLNILKIVVSIVAALISVYLIPLIKAKLADEKYAQLVEVVEIAVRAAEQTMDTKFGQVKKDAVVKFASDWMIDHGIAITQEQLDQIIEAAVFNMNREVKEW